VAHELVVGFYWNSPFISKAFRGLPALGRGPRPRTPLSSANLRLWLRTSWYSWTRCGETWWMVYVRCVSRVPGDPRHGSIVSVVFPCATPCPAYFYSNCFFLFPCCKARQTSSCFSCCCLLHAVVLGRYRWCHFLSASVLIFCFVPSQKDVSLCFMFDLFFLAFLFHVIADTRHS
jgi:hypothetical protein